MTEPEFAEFFKLWCGRFTWYKATPEKRSSLWGRFSRFELELVKRAVHQWDQEHPDSDFRCKPEREILAIVQAAYREPEADERWNLAFETELSLLLHTYYDAKGIERPPIEHVIREHMHREPPPFHKRSAVLNAMKNAGVKPFNEVFALQLVHIDSMRHADALRRESAKQAGKPQNKWLVSNKRKPLESFVERLKRSRFTEVVDK